MISLLAQRSILRLILYTAVVAPVFFLFSIRPGVHLFEKATFPDMMSGTAHKPYVLRALMPATVRLCVAMLPLPVRESVARLYTGKYSDMAHMFQWEEGWIVERAVASVLMFACFLALAFVLRALARDALPVPGIVADMTPVGAFLFLPVFFRYVGFIYDPVTLLLSGLALLLLVRRQFWLYYLAFIPAVANKETSLVLIGLFLVFGKEELGRRALLAHAGAQLLFWALVRTGFHMMFSGNPGPPVEFHLFDHTLALWKKPEQLLYLLVMGGIMGWLVGFRWREKPLLLRQALLVTAGPLVLSSLFFGYVEEFRVDYEAFPVAVLLGVLTVVALLGQSEPRTAPGR